MTKKKATKKKAVKKTKKKATRKPVKVKDMTMDQIDAAEREQAKVDSEQQRRQTFERNRELRKQYEAERPDIAPWVGWEEYVAARGRESRIKAVGIIGAIMRGEKRTEIRKKFRISPNKLNAILNSETVDNILAYSLGHIYSFQTECVEAILHKLREEKDGSLALTLLEKMGVFANAKRLVQQSGGEPKDEDATQAPEDIFAVMFAKGDTVQARQAREAIERIVVDSVKARED